MRIPDERCSFMHREPVKYAREKRIRGTVVGAYMNKFWHPWMYSAYHIVADDGRKFTILAKLVRFNDGASFPPMRPSDYI
jgi:hypothetical protein